MLNNFEKFSFPSIEKDGQKTKRQTDKKKKRKEKKKRKKTPIRGGHLKTRTSKFD